MTAFVPVFKNIFLFLCTFHNYFVENLTFQIMCNPGNYIFPHLIVIVPADVCFVFLFSDILGLILGSLFSLPCVATDVSAWLV